MGCIPLLLHKRKDGLLYTINIIIYIPTEFVCFACIVVFVQFYSYLYISTVLYMHSQYVGSPATCIVATPATEIRRYKYYGSIRFLLFSSKHTIPNLCHQSTYRTTLLHLPIGLSPWSAGLSP